MITILNDTLVMKFPETQAAFSEYAGKYVEKWSKRIAVSDLMPALEKLREFSWLQPDQKESARKAVAAITTEALLEAQLREVVDSVLQEHRPEVHISFQRTLRLPDDGKTYPLPPGLGQFPLRSLSSPVGRIPANWQRRGGVLMPMYQAEALWLDFEASYPVALKVGTGLVNAITGRPWADGLSLSPQDHLVLPEQPWLDGYCAGAGMIRQFVAARLGKGYTAEEQLEGTAAGGLQFEAVPIKPEIFIEQELKDELPRNADDLVRAILREELDLRSDRCYCLAESVGGMGLGAGGKMKQDIYEDPWAVDAWDLSGASRCWVHLCDAARWLHITGEMPSHQPIAAKDYAEYGLPWFDFYREDLKAVEGSPILAGIKSVFALGSEQNDESIPQEASVTPGPVFALGPHAPTNRIIEWDGR